MDAPALAAYLKTRLRDAEGDWQRLVEAMYRHLVDQPFEQIVDRQRVRTLAGSYLNARRMEDLVRVAVTAAVRPAVEEARVDAEPIGRWVPEEAQKALEDFAAEEGLVDGAWVEQLFAQEAAEELLAETLYQALKDFSTLVPRVLQNILPSGLGRLAGFAATAGGKMFDEVERVLDGEIRRFLEKGTRKALDQAAAFAAQNLDSPTAREGRRNMVRFALQKTGQFHVERLTDDRIARLEAIARTTLVHIAERDETSAVVDRLVEQVYSVHQGRTLKEVLAVVGVESDPAFDDWARATWPVLSAAVETPEVQAWIDDLAAGFFASAPNP